MYAPWMLVGFPALDKPPPEFRTLRPFRFAAKRCSFIRELPTGRAEVPSINGSKVPSAGAPSEITKRRGPCDAVGGECHDYCCRCLRLIPCVVECAHQGSVVGLDCRPGRDSNGRLACRLRQAIAEEIEKWGKVIRRLISKQNDEQGISEGGSYEISPPSISASGRGHCVGVDCLARREGPSLSITANYHDRSVRCWGAE